VHCPNWTSGGKRFGLKIGIIGAGSMRHDKPAEI
jgi:hypothetical protein